MHSLLKSVYERYSELKMGTSEICNQCRDDSSNELAGPVPIYHVGKSYHKDGLKVLFIGSAAYGFGASDQECPISLDDWRAFHSGGAIIPKFYNAFEKRITGIFTNNTSNFWHIIRLVTKKLYSNESLEEGYEKIAITNFMKCNKNESSKYDLPNEIRANCAHPCKKQMFAYEEIQVLKPIIVVSLACNKDNAYFSDYEKEYYNNKEPAHPIKVATLNRHPMILEKGESTGDYADELFSKIKEAE